MNRTSRVWIAGLLALRLCSAAFATAAVLMEWPGMETEPTLKTVNDPNLFAEKLIPLRQKEFELTISPATGLSSSYRLLPLSKDRIDEDAADLYAAAWKQLRGLVDPNDLPRQEYWEQRRNDPEGADRLLERCGEIFQTLEKASLCRYCSWPEVHPSQWRSFEEELEKMSAFARLLALQVRRDIDRGRYDRAAKHLRVGLATARHQTTHADLLLALDGARSAEFLLSEIEYWISRPGAPSLYRALQDLPTPLLPATDLTRYAPSSQRSGYRYGRGGYAVMIPQPSIGEPTIQYPQGPSAPVFLRVERWKAMLQLVEAIRYVAALNDGRLPELAEMTETALPADPVTRRGFGCEREGDAILIEPSPAGDSAYDAQPLRCRLRLESIEWIAPAVPKSKKQDLFEAPYF
jgi:hypothetical protein